MIMMTERVKNKKGFTLAETLMAVLILLLVASVVAAGIPAAANAYTKAVDAANAHALLSTTISALRSELGVAMGVEKGTDGNSVIYYSARTGAKTKIYLGDATIKLASGEHSVKEILVQDYLELDGQSSGVKDNKPYNLVSKIKSSNNRTSPLYVKWKENPTIDTENGIVTFHKLVVLKAPSDTELVTIDKLTIKALIPDSNIPGFWAEGG